MENVTTVEKEEIWISTFMKLKSHLNISIQNYPLQDTLSYGYLKSNTK